MAHVAKNGAEGNGVGHFREESFDVAIEVAREAIGLELAYEQQAGKGSKKGPVEPVAVDERLLQSAIKYARLEHPYHAEHTLRAAPRDQGDLSDIEVRGALELNDAEDKQCVQEVVEEYFRLRLYSSITARLFRAMSKLEGEVREHRLKHFNDRAWLEDSVHV